MFFELQGRLKIFLKTCKTHESSGFSKSRYLLTFLGNLMFVSFSRGLWQSTELTT